jgi:hypothetical protein
VKKVRLAIICLIAVLIAAVFFYMDNRQVNALKNHQTYPLIEEPNQHPQALTASSQSIADSSVHLTKLYSRNNANGLFFGMYYGDRNKTMKNKERNWKRENGHIEFLVKAVDSNGTTYNGHTVGTVEGTFTTFRYIQFNDFRYDQSLDTIELSFYPIVDDEEEIPHEHAWLETTVEVE